MLNGLIILFGLVAIIMLLVECICSVYIGVYGLFNISRNCIKYIISPEFRKKCKESSDKQFMLKSHNKKLWLPTAGYFLVM